MKAGVGAGKSFLGPLAKLGSGPRVNYDARVGAGLSRGPNQKKTTDAVPWSPTWPAPGATLDLDFANDRGYVRGVGQGRSMDAVTFTRASNATFVKPDGTLSTHANQGALGKNLFSSPQDFSNTYWVKQSVLLTSSQEVAPDGTLTADLIVDTNATGSPSNHRVHTNISFSAGSYTVSFYVKNVDAQWLHIRNGTAALSTFFDIVNDVVGQENLGTGTITNLDNGWKRLSVSFTDASSFVSIGIGFATADGVNSYTTSTGTRFYLWGAQLELGSTATEYFPTNINQPRFDWASTAQLPQNLLRYTEQFDNAYWSKVAVAVTPDTETAPNGTLTADYFNATNPSNAFPQINLDTNVLPNTNYVFSIYAKQAERTSLVVQVRSGATIISTVVNTTNLDSNWIRLSGSFNTQNLTSVTLRILFSASSVSWSGTQGIYIWGAQLELGDTATEYKSNGAFAPTNTPLTANPTSNGLLIEESRTNRILWNRDATQANWVKTDVTAAKDQTGIDGVANAASSLTATADGGTCIQTITLASGSRTGSVYLKRITGTGTVQVSLDGSTWSTVDLSSTEWRRIVLSGTVTNPTVGIKIATNGDAVAMDYAQVEDGAFATTPILTTTATVTRSGDVATMGGQLFRDWHRPDEGTVYTEIKPYVLGAANGVTINNNTTSNRIRVTVNSTSDQSLITTGGTAQATLNGGTPVANTVTKLATAYRINDFALSLNGGNVATDTGGTVPAVTQIQFGSETTTVGNTTISRAVFHPKRLNDVVLQELTK